MKLNIVNILSFLLLIFLVVFMYQKVSGKRP